MEPPAPLRGLLACLYCGAGLAPAGGALRCPAGHTFDVARQGYVSMLRGDAPAAADSAEMVAARERVLAGGHLRFLTAALRDLAVAVGPPGPVVVVDAGGGTGHHLRGVLDALADRGPAGVLLDRSAPAVRRAARLGDDVLAVRCDVWTRWPLVGGAVALVLDVFAPRNAGEARRVLRPDGRLLVVTPAAGHLHELSGLLDLLAVDPDKDVRLAAQLAGHFELVHERSVSAELRLGRDTLADLVRMGPSAWHRTPAEVEERLAAAPAPVAVTAAVTLRAYRPVPQAPHTHENRRI